MHIDQDVQSLGGGGGLGFGGGGSNPLLWLITLAFLGNRNGVLGGGGDVASGAAVVGVAENSAKLDCLQQGHASLMGQIAQTQTSNEFNNISRQISELASVDRDIQDSIFRETSALSRALADCCCELQKGQSDIQTAVALQTNTLVSNADQNTQRILDNLCESRIQALQTANATLRSELSESRIIAECDSRRH